MELQIEIGKLTQYLNVYQKEFLECTTELFNKIPSENLGLNSEVKFNSKNNILEIILVHSKDSEMSLLFLIHSDMIEIACSEFEYYMDSMNNALFEGLPKKEFYAKTAEFVSHALKTKFKLIHYSYKEKRIKGKIEWENGKYPSYQHNYSVFGFLYKKKSLNKKEVRFKSFIN